MELAFKTASIAVTVSLMSLIVKRTNPELSSLMSLTAIIVFLAAALSSCEGIREVYSEIKLLTEDTGKYLIPVVRCTAIGVVTRLASELCRDASQSSMAAAVELAGAMCAFAVAVPMLLTMLRMIGDIV